MAADPKPTGAKKATAYFLGKAYTMEIKSSDGTAVSFYLPKNMDSVYRKKVQYGIWLLNKVLEEKGNKSRSALKKKIK